MLFPESSCVSIPSFRPVIQFFSGKSTIFGFLKIYKNVCGHIDILNSNYIWVCGSNFNRSNVNRGYTDRHTDKEADRIFPIYSINKIMNI